MSPMERRLTLLAADGRAMVGALRAHCRLRPQLKPGVSETTWLRTLSDLPSFRDGPARARRGAGGRTFSSALVCDREA